MAKFVVQFLVQFANEPNYEDTSESLVKVNHLQMKEWSKLPSLSRYRQTLQFRLNCFQQQISPEKSPG